MTDCLEVFGLVRRQQFSLPWRSVPAGRPGRVVDGWQAQPAYDPFFSGKEGARESGGLLKCMLIFCLPAECRWSELLPLPLPLSLSWYGSGHCVNSYS